MNPWFRMASDATFMMWDAQRVTALNVMRLATGGLGPWPELAASDTENVDALTAPNVASVGKIVEGDSAPAPVKKVARKSQNRLEASKSRHTKSRAKKRKRSSR
jgi:hypothetical protein